MAASYPGAIKTFSAITTGTILTQAHFDEMHDEIEAMQAEFGLNPHGSAGSVAERIALLLGDESFPNGLKEWFAGNTERRRIRAGVVAVDCDDLTAGTRTKSGTITFSPPVPALTIACHAMLMMQNLEPDPSVATAPAWVSYIRNSGTTTSFGFRVGARAGLPAAGTSFLLHWLAFEKDIAAFDDTGF